MKQPESRSALNSSNTLWGGHQPPREAFLIPRDLDTSAKAKDGDVAVMGTGPIVKDEKVDYGLVGQKNFLLSLSLMAVTLVISKLINISPRSPEAPGIPRIRRVVLVPFSEVKREICIRCNQDNVIWIVLRYSSTLLFGALGSITSKGYFYACESCGGGYELTRAEVKALKSEGKIRRFRIPLKERHGFSLASLLFSGLVLLVLLVLIAKYL